MERETAHNQRLKIGKSAEEFKNHERELMIKRITEINNVITKKCDTIWSQYLFHQAKPENIALNFEFKGLDQYLKVSDCYKPKEHKDPKQKWWNNQKASEMSQDFLPAVLNATDQMAMYIGQHIEDPLKKEFTHYVIFELLETAISSIFKTLRNGSNEVFLRTSFQYSKAQLRMKLVNYFKKSEVAHFNAKQRKKKENWYRLIKEKRDRLLSIFLQKKSMSDTNTNHLHVIHDANNTNSNSPSLLSENVSINNNNNNNYNVTTKLTAPIHDKSNDNISINAEPAYWNEIQTQQQRIPHIGPYPSMVDHALTSNASNYNKYIETDSRSYGNHRQCVQCINYMEKTNQLLQENQNLKQMINNHELERQNWRNKYVELLGKFQNLAEIVSIANNMNINSNNNHNVNHQMNQVKYDYNNNNNNNNIQNNDMNLTNIGNEEWSMPASIIDPMQYNQNPNDIDIMMNC